MNIKTIDAFLSEEECKFYYNFCQGSNLWDKSISNSIWSQRIIFADQVEELKNLNYKFLLKVEQAIKSEINIDKEIWPDYLGLVKWRTGDVQYPHADSESPDGEKHPFFWRNFGCVYYLNDNYQGGEIYFPNQNLEIKPKPNTLVFFPGTLEYLHGVKQITEKTRFTLTSFWTFDSKYKMRYDYHS